MLSVTEPEGSLNVIVRGPGIPVGQLTDGPIATWNHDEPLLLAVFAVTPALVIAGGSCAESHGPLKPSARTDGAPKLIHVAQAAAPAAIFDHRFMHLPLKVARHGTDSVSIYPGLSSINGAWVGPCRLRQALHPSEPDRNAGG